MHMTDNIFVNRTGFKFVSAFRLNLSSTQVPVQKELRALFTGLKDLESEAARTYVSNTEVNNV
jgi:hypothetical protein